MHRIILPLLLAIAPIAYGQSPALLVDVLPSHVAFSADVHMGPSIQNPPSRRPLAGMKVLMWFRHASTGGVHIVNDFTDDRGRIVIPGGYVPLVGIVSGPQGRHVRCFRYILLPGSNIHREVSPTVNIDFSVSPPRITDDGISGGLLGVDLDAFHHAQLAHRHHLGLFPGYTEPVKVTLFDLGSPLTPAVYIYPEHEIRIWGASPPDAAVYAKSLSVVAHEMGHHFLHGVYGNAVYVGALNRLNEGLSDFLASLAARTPLIGAGARGPGSVVRTVDNNARYTIPPHHDDHIAGMVISGALYHTRQNLAALGPGHLAGFDAILGTLISSRPRDEVALLFRLLLLDDDDGNLLNGTPHDAEIYDGFHVRHGIPWPIPLPVAGGTGRWRPQLAAAKREGESSIVVDLQLAPPLSKGLIVASLQTRGCGAARGVVILPFQVDAWGDAAVRIEGPGMEDLQTELRALCLDGGPASSEPFALAR